MRYDQECGHSDEVFKVRLEENTLAQFETESEAWDWIWDNEGKYQGKTLSIVCCQQFFDYYPKTYDEPEVYSMNDEVEAEEMIYKVPFFCSKCGDELQNFDGNNEYNICGACAQ